MSISERAAYLRGLADGLNLDTANGEGKLLAVSYTHLTLPTMAVV